MDPNERDDLIEELACAIEEGSILDFVGILARKKRDREDREIRAEAVKKERKRLGEFLRSYKSGRGNDSINTLARIAELPPVDVVPTGTYAGMKRDHSLLVKDAWPLASLGWVNIYASIKCNSNSIPPESIYRIEITDKGRAVLQEAKNDQG